MQINKIAKGLADSLLNEFKTEDLITCLNKIGVTDPNEKLLYYSDITAWTRGGAETYIAVSEIKTETKEIRFIAKALISMAIKPDQQLKNWISRREVIEHLGIKTPVLFSAINGVIYEQYIQDSFFINSSLSEDIIAQLSKIAALLDKAGFASRSFSRDLRVENDKLYYIDFGSDLGEPSSHKKDFAWKHLLEKLNAQQISVAEPVYLKIMRN